MTTQKIEIDDTLNDRTKDSIDELKELIKQYILDNPDDTSPCLSNDIDRDGGLHEIIYDNTPTQTKEINDTWYLNKDKLIKAVEDEGWDFDSRHNGGTTAIYAYIRQECWDWWCSIEDDLHTDLDDAYERGLMNNRKELSKWLESVDYLN